MKMAHRREGIFWMVRLLGALGFLMVAVMIGQSGLQLQSMRASRERLQEQEEHLNQATREILQRAGEARREIQGLSTKTHLSRRNRALSPVWRRRPANYRSQRMTPRP